jgi:hypothetical protein
MNNTFCKNCHRIPSQCCCTPAKTLIEEKCYEVVFDGENYTTKLVEPKLKALTDEEILKVALELKLIHYYDADGEWSGVTNEDMFEKEKHRNDERLLEILKPFANAILRKAQEK